MTLYIRKPKTVRAVLWSGTNEEEMHDILKGTSYMHYRNLITKTLVFDIWSEGYTKRVRISDVVIRDEDDHLYLENEKCFNKNYEVVDNG